MADNFQNAFSNFTKDIEAGKVAPITSETVIEEPVEAPAANNPAPEEEDDPFAGAVIAGVDLSDDAPSNATTGVPTSAATTNTMKDRWRAMLREKMNTMATRSPEEFKTEEEKIILNMINYRKEIMVRDGLTAEEADKAVDARINRQAVDSLNKYLEANPELAVVTIDKSKSENLEFTPAEKEKLVKTKAIRLVEIEDQALQSIKIKAPLKDEVLYSAMHRVTCNIAKYSMPMINTFDVCEFSGATTAQLVQAVYDDNNSLYKRTQEQLELIYAKFLGSTTIDKYGPDGNIIFTKDDFAKWFKFYDLPVAMYSIYVASSTEEITSAFSCDKQDGGCDETFNFTYNCKSLISYKDIPDEFKVDLDDILANEVDRTGMTKLKEERRVIKRFKSPYTQNVYEISSPSVARALNILRIIRPTDRYANYLAFYAMLFNSIYVYDPSDGEYFKLENDDHEAAIKIMRFLYDINDIEIKLIEKVANSMYYVPAFEITTKCEHCGKERTSEFSVDELVFLKAQNIGEEIV